jgi:hypothetical protein
MKFESHGRQYEIDRFGVINQTDHKPFKYDPGYAGIYDSPEYTRGSEILQAMRYGFICSAHGRPINSIADCGYGNGAFMKFVKQQVPYVYGFDVTGVQVDGCYILPELVKADVLCFWDCLEHIADLSFIKDLPHETIAVSLPYCHFFTQGLEWFNDWKHRKPDEHVHHFTEFSLTLLMDSMGWKTVSISQHEDVIRQNIISKASGYKTKCGFLTEGIETFKDPLQNILSMAFKRK